MAAMKRDKLNDHMLVKSIAGMLLFVFFLFFTVERCSLLLYPLNDIVKNWLSFYNLETQSIEILIVGSSHAYSSFDVEMIQKQTGKDAYILASNSQNVVQTYFNVKEALNYQKPEVIYLEAFSINGSNNWRENGDKDWKKESNIDGMRFGLIKLEAIQAQYLPSNWAYAFFRIARCHGNWTDPAQIYTNYLFLREGVHDFSCFRPSQSIMSEDVMEKYANAEKDTTEYCISEINEQYFHKLAVLCREKDIELRVVMSPMYDTYINSINYESWTNKIMSLAESEDVNYLDCNLYYNEIGLNAQDFEDAYNGWHHTNYSGAQKVTDFILEVFDETQINGYKHLIFTTESKQG